MSTMSTTTPVRPQPRRAHSSLESALEARVLRLPTSPLTDPSPVSPFFTPSPASPAAAKRPTMATPPGSRSEPSTVDGPALAALLAPRVNTLMSDSVVSEHSQDHDLPASPNSNYSNRSGKFTAPLNTGQLSAEPLLMYASDEIVSPTSMERANTLNWNRAHSEIVTVSTTSTTTDSKTATTTTTTTTTTRTLPGSTDRHVASSPRRREPPISPSHRRQRRAASHLGTESTPLSSSSFPERYCPGPDPSSYRSVSSSYRSVSPLASMENEKPRRRRKSSYLTGAFVKRKGSAFGWIPDQLRDVKLAAEDVEPIHPKIRLARFGSHWSSDAIVLYTNSLRAELNDLVFLTSRLEASCGCDPLEKHGQHKNIQADFELWFPRFSQYAELLLKGFEDYLFPMVTELLHQRDVMLSRRVARIEAEGISYVQAWSASSTALFIKMEEVRDALSTVDNRVLRIQRNRFNRGQSTASDVWNALFDSLRRLVPVFADLLEDLDDRISELLALGSEAKKLLKKLYRQFALLITREGNMPLGWSGVTTLLRWIGDRKLKSDHASQMARASKQSLFQRYRAGNSHHTIVRVHKTLAREEARRKTSFFPH